MTPGFLQKWSLLLKCRLKEWDLGRRAAGGEDQELLSERAPLEVPSSRHPGTCVITCAFESTRVN